MASPYDTIFEHDELSLDELFAEPMVQLFMQRDGVRPHEMREQLTRALQWQPAA